jgi:hypothetical protein
VAEIEKHRIMVQSKASSPDDTERFQHLALLLATAKFQLFCADFFQNNRAVPASREDADRLANQLLRAYKKANVAL